MLNIVGIGPGNQADYLTVRGYNTLKNADIAIYVGEMIGIEIIKIFKPECAIHIGTALSKQEIKDLILLNKNQNKIIALMILGDLVFYSGQFNKQLSVGEYVTWLKKENIEFELVPGISSLSASIARLKIELTDFSGTQNVFISSIGRLKELNQFDIKKLKPILDLAPNIVLFQSFSEWYELKGALIDHYSPKSEVIFICKLSLDDQKIIKTTLLEADSIIKTQSISNHSLIIITPYR